MNPLAPQLDRITARILEDFREKSAAREKALRNSREVIRHAANAIRAVHRGEMATAEDMLRQGEALLQETAAVLARHHDVYYAGFVHDAQKEYAEAHLTRALVAGDALPSPEDLGVGNAAYLNGAGETVGELRRQVLDRLRQGETQRCEELLAAMDDIYSVLVTVDFPDAMTGGLRRTTDSVRGILERTRGDLTMALVQSSLERRLDDFQERLSPGKETAE